MALFQWKDAYSVHIAEIDKQHKQLIEMVNELHEAMAKGKGKEALGQVLARLIDYTKVHFAFEEDLMRKNGYPEYDAHKAKHDKMAAKVLNLQSQYRQGKAQLTFEVTKFLQDWLNKHILGTDKQYAPFLNGKGIQ